MAVLKSTIRSHGIDSSLLEPIDEVSAEKRIADILGDSALLTARINQAVRNAVLSHKAAGHSISTWQDGHVTRISPDDIDFPEIYSPVEAGNLKEF